MLRRGRWLERRTKIVGNKNKDVKSEQYETETGD